MATYKNINGTNIPIRASDPTNPILGEIWYNTTSNTLKGQGYTSGTISSAPNLNRPTANVNQMGGSSGSPSNSNFVNGGNGFVTTTEEYDGSSWASANNSSTGGTNKWGFGTQTAGLISGGLPAPGVSAVTTTEYYDGTNWTSGTATPVGVRGAGSGGSFTAGLYFGGHGNPTYPVAYNGVQFFDGSAWTAQGGTINTAKANIGGNGTQTSAIKGNGEPDPSTVAETWDGTSWTTVASLNQTRANGGLSLSGDSGTAVFFAGGSPAVGVEEWNGSAWATSPVSSPTAFSQGISIGNATSAVFAVGNTSQSTFEWSKGPVTQTISSS